MTGLNTHKGQGKGQDKGGHCYCRSGSFHSWVMAVIRPTILSEHLCQDGWEALGGYCDGKVKLRKSI